MPKKEKSIDAVRFGRAIEKHREAHGWTFGQLEQRSGVAKSYLSRLEDGQHPNVSAKKLAGIALAFGLGVDYFCQIAGWLPAPEEIGDLAADERELIGMLRKIRSPIERRELLDNIMGLLRFSADVDQIVQERLRLVAEEQAEYTEEDEE